MPNDRHPAVDQRQRSQQQGHSAGTANEHLMLRKIFVYALAKQAHTRRPLNAMDTCSSNLQMESKEGGGPAFGSRGFVQSPGLRDLARSEGLIDGPKRCEMQLFQS
uniref:Uncharacterized protein n=1 Tax=Physcomitrium patens TaxID=3218 RepID=A0A2K1JQK0_PHYPA|nr:hypothetical protein PHYPA_016200 [Physcomitrium patens]PNR43818.1 hypothetical protein PHYPA_016201 [Physcomitrium patens]